MTLSYGVELCHNYVQAQLFNLQQVKYHKQSNNYILFNTYMVTEDGKWKAATDHTHELCVNLIRTIPLGCADDWRIEKCCVLYIYSWSFPILLSTGPYNL